MDFLKKIPLTHYQKIVVLLMLLIGGCFILIYPWQRNITISAVIAPKHYTLLPAPANATLQQMFIACGDVVRKDEIIAIWSMPELNLQAQNHQLEVNARVKQMAEFKPQHFASEAALYYQHALQKSLEQQEKFNETLAKFTTIAPFDGVLVDCMPHTEAHMPYASPSILGRLYNPQEWQVVAWLTEHEHKQLKKMNTATFTRIKPFEKFALHFDHVGIHATQTIEFPEVQGNTWHPLKIQSVTNGILTVKEPLYPIVFTFKTPLKTLPEQVEVGDLIIAKKRESFLMQWLDL
jgi:hypothetical protein